jgi:glyoxylase-like metal-dependent hydrolase (beta-lactamase superfamily II)
MAKGIEAFHTNGGGRIYRIPLDLFPFLQGYAHLVLADDVVALVDVGSGFMDSNEQLAESFTQIRSQFDEDVSWERLTHILITHGHIDHFGGLHFARQHTQAPIGIHHLDAKVLMHYEERVALMAKRLGQYLIEAGVSDAYREELMNTYLINKQLFSSLSPDFSYQAVGMKIGRMEILHVPGHCPGQIVIRLDNVLLSGDHILPHITPHQAPERLSLNMGLGHYLDSLEKTRRWINGVQWVVGGHGEPMHDLHGRIAEIEESHRDRLEQILNNLDEPKTLAEISGALFPDVDGYDKLLAVEEAGAHVEYLAQLGYAFIDNLDDLDSALIVPFRYRRADGLEPAWFPFGQKVKSPLDFRTKG